MPDAALPVALFIGDSITDCHRRDDPEGLGAGYVRLLAQGPAGESWRIENRGISGDRVVDLRRRWVDDCLALEPSVLTVYVGVNDTWRRFDAGMETVVEVFERDYAALLTAARDLTSLEELVLIEPFVLPVTAEQEQWGPLDLDAKRAVVRDLAARFDAALIPLPGILGAAAAEHGVAAIAEDGVHPTALGHEIIAAAWSAR